MTFEQQLKECLKKAFDKTDDGDNFFDQILRLINAIEVKEEYPPYPNFGKGQVNNPPEKSENEKKLFEINKQLADNFYDLLKSKFKVDRCSDCDDLHMALARAMTAEDKVKELEGKLKTEYVYMPLVGGGFGKDACDKDYYAKLVTVEIQAKELSKWRTAARKLASMWHGRNEVIANIAGVSVEELFPKHEEEQEDKI